MTIIIVILHSQCLFSFTNVFINTATISLCILEICIFLLS